MTERRKLPRSDKPIPIRIPKPLLERIKAAGEALGYSDAEVIRLAVSVGLERLRRINYDLSGAICDAAEKSPTPKEHRETA
jgi:hypothetical protein